jgi:ABC-type sugar transport system substrate-binding protein
MNLRVTLVLIDAGNQFQQLLRKDAEEAARKAGVVLDTIFTGEGLTDHTGALRGLLVDDRRRPEALVVMAVRDRGLDRIVREAAAAGVHWVFLNAVEDDLDAVRREFPKVSVSVLCPDEVETGRVQGRQLRALLPDGRRALYVQGNPRSLASRQRTAGVQEATAGQGFDVALAGGDWTPEAAAQTVRDWLRLGSSTRRPFDLVACQNDHMAAGVLEALAEGARETGHPEIARTPVTGCDGAPDVGQRMVREGRLAATVVLPRVAGPAVQMVAGVLRQGTRPEPVVTVAAESFPPLGEMRSVA